MRVYTRIFNKMREVEEFLNSAGIQKENIVNIFQSQDGSFVLVYYGEE